MKTAFVLGLASSVVVGCLAWSTSVLQRLPSRAVPKRSRATTMSAWTGDRRPETNPGRLSWNMDASYNREGIRTVDYMDYDQQNPPAQTEWWMGYFPSQEEQEAAAAGFNFSDPDGWLSAKAAGTLTPVNPEEETEMVMVSGMTAIGREWPDRTKQVVIKK